MVQGIGTEIQKGLKITALIIIIITISVTLLFTFGFNILFSDDINNTPIECIGKNNEKTNLIEYKVIDNMILDTINEELYSKNSCKIK